MQIPAPISSRLKAFLTDIFMVSMPILYITAYVFLDGKEDFQTNQIAIFLCTLAYGLIISIFFAITGQSPGYRAYGIYLINVKTAKKPNFFIALFRYFLFLIAATSVFGIFLCFFRKDKRNFHDLLSFTAVVKKKN